MTMHTVKLEPGRKEALRGLLVNLRGEAVAKASGAKSMRSGTKSTQARPSRAPDNYIALIDDALERIDRGTYGFCDECGEEISIERLARSPLTPYCANCERREKRREPVKGE